MRVKKSKDGLSVNAVAGTHVVMLGFDLEPQARKGCLGFAISREDLTEDERYWLSGMKTFQETDPGLGPGGRVSSREHPIQSFQWADYSAKPGYDYIYKVIPMYGTPANLKEGAAVTVKISTEPEFGEKHSVFFNRGAVASQEYARRFQNQSPDEAGPAAYKWLQRGLLDALIKFIARANGPQWSIHAAIYEFQWHEALAAFREAKNCGADVHIIYDDIPGNGPGEKNNTAIAKAKIKQLCTPRTNGKIMHNKFVVLSKKNKPVAVWTGSTNLTENGIFGHSNCGHIIEDSDVAQAFLDYWQEMKGDPESKEERAWMGENNPAPPDSWDKEITHVFSPRTGLKVLDWYADIAAMAEKGLFMTFAFGMHKSFQQVYEQNDGVLRFALMEKMGNGAGLAQGKIDIGRIRRLPNVIVAVGNSIITNKFDRWLQEHKGLSKNVKWIHTKFMLVDPLGDSPIVVTGSANFSAASTNTNNENMVVICGDTRVADIYLGEFMRLHAHYAFREAVANSPDWDKNKQWQPKYLASKAADWQKGYFTKGHPKCIRREYFAGK